MSADLINQMSKAIHAKAEHQTQMPIAVLMSMADYQKVRRVGNPSESQTFGSLPVFVPVGLQRSCVLRANGTVVQV